MEISVIVKHRKLDGSAPGVGFKVERGTSLIDILRQAKNEGLQVGYGVVPVHKRPVGIEKKDMPITRNARIEVIEYERIEQWLLD